MVDADPVAIPAGDEILPAGDDAEAVAGWLVSRLLRSRGADQPVAPPNTGHNC